MSTAALVGLVGLVRPASANTSTVFPAGSIIIPTGAAFQDDCGAVSAYGLIYDVLRANPWLAANGYSPITIYYTYLDTKSSPNRCVPTSLNTGTAPSGPPTTSTAWNDGCDITNVSAQLINNANHLLAPTNIISYETAAASTSTNECSGGTSFGNSCATVGSIASDCPGTANLGDCGAATIASCTANLGATCTLNTAQTACTHTNASGSCTFNAATGSACITGTHNVGQACTTGALGDAYCGEYSCAAVTASLGAKSNVYPTYTSKTVGPGQTVSYLGGPFVIAAQDVATFRALLDGTLVSTIGGKCSDGTTCASSSSCGATTTGVCGGPVNSKATDISGHVIDFTPFSNAPGVAPNTSQKLAPISTCVIGTNHHVNVHVTTGTFTVNVGKAFQDVPPRLALLSTDKNGHTQTISNGILEGYLSDAGLTYAGANGCPPGSVNASNSAVCPNGGASGQIYDAFDIDDIANNELAATSGGRPLYSMLWTPHWETTTSCTSHNASCIRVGVGSCTVNSTSTGCNATGAAICAFAPAYFTCTGVSALEASALANITTFLNGKNGLSAECASLASYEGDFETGVQQEERGLQLQTCIDNGTGNCAGSTTLYGIDRNPNPPGVSSAGGGGGGGGAALTLKNCSDPGMTTGGECAYFSYPGDSFAQTGDYIWQAVTGHTAAFVPNTATSSIYRPGVVPLISAAGLNPALLGTPGPYNGCPVGQTWASCLTASALAARPMIQADLATRSVKDNTPGESNILYLAGHDQSSSVAGTKMMLETLLQLGISTLPPLTNTTEVSRNSPIVATVSGNPAVFQGTFEDVIPAPTPTSFSVATDATAFRFPTVHGHLRARQASSITVLSTTFGFNGVLFDAAANIPLPIYTGCGSWFTSSCRTVFTTITSGANPTLHYLQQSELATIGPLMGPAVGANPALSSGDQATLMQRVLAGNDTATPGTFLPALGGVDRSTVAVIGTSTLVSGTRQTMAYFGATDGMLHAVCASVGGSCDVLGRELWAYLPQTLLPVERYNTGVIEGSPRVMDMFGDFYNTGTKSWRTILTFTTGSGDTTLQTRVPAVYALDISDPTSPKVVWEYALNSVTTRGVYEMGVGLTLAAGQIHSGALTKYLVFAQTNNAGTGGAGSVVTAIDAEKGTAYWQTGYTYPAPRTVGHAVVPSTGIPGGAIAVDKIGAGYITDLVYATLYGDLWEIDPTTGANRYGTRPEFSFSTDFHPIGAQPAIYSKGGTQYAVITDGGYADPSFDTNWTTAATTHYAVGVWLNAPTADATFNETKGSPDIGFSFAFGAGQTGVAQALVVGGQVFVTTETNDVNSAAYGTSTTASGHVYSMDLTSNTLGATVVVQGGASSLANSGTSLYSGASTQTAQLATGANSATGTSVDSTLVARVQRNLWLRTQ